MRIAVDALGGDDAPSEIVYGTVEVARKLPEVDFVLVGARDAVEPCLQRVSDRPKNVTLVESGGAVGMNEEPAAALKARPDASVAVAASLLRRGEADALFSAGNTGATVAASLLRIGRLKDCRRPALATVLPFPRPVLLLDAGATISCRPRDLVNFAILGGVFARRYFRLEGEARVGLINVGEEPGKGNELTKEAHSILSELPQVEFVGNVEGRELGGGVADVLVTDGFTGNIVLKTAEGTAREIFSMVRSAIREGGLPAKVAGAVLRTSLVSVRDRVDPENYGGSFLLGVNGAVVIGHGNSQARGVENALLGLARTADGLTDELHDALIAASAEIFGGSR